MLPWTGRELNQAEKVLARFGLFAIENELVCYGVDVDTPVIVRDGVEDIRELDLVAWNVMMELKELFSGVFKDPDATVATDADLEGIGCCRFCCRPGCRLGRVDFAHKLERSYEVC